MNKLVAGMMTTVSLIGCGKRSLPPEEFMKAYRKAGEIRIEGPAHTISVLYKTTEYLIAESAEIWDSTVSLESLRHELDNGYLIQLSLVTSSPGNLLAQAGNDLLHSGAASMGNSARNRMDFLKRRMGEKFHLQTRKGVRVPPSIVRYSPHRAISPVTSFVLLFPKEWQGEPINLGDCRFILEDIGLGTGRITGKIKTPDDLKLEV